MRNRNITTIIVILCFCLIATPAQAQGASQDLLGRINGLRSSLGLSPYRLNSALTSAANSHAQWMVATSQVTHVQDNGSSPQSRANAAGYNSAWVSENIYMGGLASVDTAWTFWINSPIHYAGLTSDNFQDVGIGTAQGEGGQAYVLVFGVPGGAVTTSSRSAAASGDNEAAQPPSAIVGYDEVGNIEYELQAGDTLGQVLLLFGYTWDDLNALLELNDLTEDDITTLDIGQVVLVPPPQGTYTPTPAGFEATEEIAPEITENPPLEPTEAAVEAQAAAIDATIAAIDTQDSSTMNPSGIIPTFDPNNTDANAIAIQSTPTAEPIIEQIGQPVTFVAVTQATNANTTETLVPTLQINNVAATAPQMPTITATTPSDTANNSASGPPLWLKIAIGVQIAILGFASFEFIRRRGK